MAEVELLGLDDVLEIHQDQIERYGGSSGLRDMGLLQSCHRNAGLRIRG
jgi:death on curing protein